MISTLDIAKSLYFFLPGMLANGIPPIVAKIPGLKKWETPVDFGKGFFGSHKTIRGIAFGISASFLTGWAQFYLSQTALARRISIFDYSRLSQVLMLSFFLGAGALLGDLAKSYFKRKKGILPGESWFWPDKTDYGVGAILFSSFYFFPGLKPAIIFLVLTPILSIISTVTGKIIGVRDVWL